MKIRLAILASAAVIGVAPIGISSAQANLLVNGDFETSTNGFSETLTPTGWTNVGHSDGVIPYSLFGTPPYNGLYFYDLGGFGNPSGPVGDGIEQTVATTPGASYVLTLGQTSEDGTGAGPSTLQVNIGASSTDYIEISTGVGALKKPFTTETIDYVATGTSTTISFIEAANAGGGNNDPMIDGISFDPSVVPVPTLSPLSSLALLVVAFAGLGLIRRWPVG